MATLAGLPITSKGLGLMRMTLPGSGLNDEQAFKVLKAALAAGANVWNGADFYGPPTANSLHLMNRYFTKYPEDASKVVFCLMTGIEDRATHKMNAAPAFLESQLVGALEILDGKKTIDLYGPCRVDGVTKIEDSVACLQKMKKDGKIGGIQLSEVAADTIKRAAKVAKIDMVEAEISLWSTDVFSNGVASTCGELGVVMLAHTPLGAGMLTGKIQKQEDIGDDHHANFPRWQGENFQKNMDLVNALGRLAEKKGCSRAQLALAWLRSRNGTEGSPWIVPIAGASSEARVEENCADVKFSKEELGEIDGVLASHPVAGTRYPEQWMKAVEY